MPLALPSSWRLGPRLLLLLLLLLRLAVQTPSAADTHEACLCASEAVVGDCCCTFRATSAVNDEHALPILRELAENTTFFRYFRVALCGQCHHSLPEPACGHPECTVCECSSEDLPCDSSGKCYLQSSSPPAGGACPEDGGPMLSPADADVDRGVGQELRTWSERRSEWTQDSPEHMEYVDLQRNPERWTGYTEVTGADRVWQAIHEQAACVADAGGGECREHRVFERLVSGLHASISMHIAEGFCVKPGPKWMPCERFGESSAEFRRRLYDHPERIENLYFAYLFMLRAAIKAEPLFTSYDYDAGDAQESGRVRKLVRSLLQYRDVPCLGVTRSPFDETTVFAGEDGAQLRAAFRDGFLNMSSIMDCVGCGRCRLWGKLQVQGLGTALRLLFGDAEQQAVSLTRTEVIALIHTLYRFSTSVHHVSRLSRQAAIEDSDEEL